jgi:serine/threonine-protein kinase
MKKLFQSPKFKKFLYLLGGILVFILILNYLIMPWYVHAKEVVVPKVLGKKTNEAISILENANLNPYIGDTTYDKKYPEGTIAIQKPYAGEVVKAGRNIYLVYSGGEPLIAVPQLRGKSIRDAKFSLARSGFKIGEIIQVASNNPKDIIVDQQYAAGTKLKSGITVDVSVSLGSAEGTIEVPEVIGKSLSEAERILNEKLLKVGKINYQPSFSVLPNTVIDQYPSKGNKLNEGDKVDLFITKNVEIKDEN